MGQRSRSSAIRLTRAVWILVILIVLANAVYYSAAYLHPPLVAYGLAIIGRSPTCPMSQAAIGVENHVRQRKAAARIASGLRLVEEDAAGFELWETPHGRWWIPKGRNAEALPTLLAQQEVKLYGAGASGVQRGDTVLDCGAHIGLFTREAMSAGARLVIAVEPAPENVECLRRNLGGEIAAGRVVAYARGVWDKDDFLTLHRPRSSSAASSFVASAPGQDVEIPKVPLTTIDKLAAECGLERVDFIKMDIKGATERALRGAQHTLSKHRPRLAISTEEPEDDPVKVAEVVRRLWPGYAMQCGACIVRDFRIYPLVLYFH